MKWEGWWAWDTQYANHQSDTLRDAGRRGREGERERERGREKEREREREREREMVILKLIVNGEQLILSYGSY